MSYTAIVLDPECQAAIKSCVSIPEGWAYRAHHMTLHMGPHDPDNDPPIGERFGLLVTDLGGDSADMAIAFRVKTQAKTVNRNPHITIAVNEAAGGKPWMSNNIENWAPTVAFTVTGTVQECA